MSRRDNIWNGTNFEAIDAATLDGMDSTTIVALEERGYLTTVRYDYKDEEFLNTLTDNGKYTILLEGVTDILDGWYNVDITRHGTSIYYCTQVLKGMHGTTVKDNLGMVYIRTLAGGVWTIEKLVSQNEMPLTSNMLKNNWALWGEGQWQNSCVVTGKTVTLDFMLKCGTIADGTVIIEGLPTRAQMGFINFTDHANRRGLFVYNSNGTISVTSYGSYPDSIWLTINAIVNI